MPHSAVVTDLIDGQACRDSEVDRVTAMRASSALAPIICPASTGDKLCVNGGVRANLPAPDARDTEANIVDAVAAAHCLRWLPVGKAVNAVLAVLPCPECARNCLFGYKVL